MIIKNNFTDKEIEKLRNFKDKYFDLYPPNLQKEIEDKLFLGFTNNEDTINQIYCYLNLVNNNVNPYKAFIKILEKNFNLKDTNILEIGSGSIPVLARYLEEKLKTKITIQDPITVIGNHNKGNIFKELFTEDTNINDFDLIIGYNPCEATEAIIRNAIKNKKDFCIATCGCCHLPKSYKEKNSKIWHEYLINIATSLGKENYKIKISYFDQRYCLENPIIIGSFKSKNNLQ